MNNVSFYEFGKSKYKPNTFIGGVAATINTPALIAAKLGILATRIKTFNVIGNDIEFAIIGSYEIPVNMFLNDTNITFYNDRDGLCLKIRYGCFSGSTSLVWVNFPEVKDIISSTWEASGNFYGCINLTTVSIPKFTYNVANSNFYIFSNCQALEHLYFPLYNGPIGPYMFYNTKSLSSLAISVTGSVGQNAFSNTKLAYIDFSNVTDVGVQAFSGMPYLTMPINAPNLLSIGNYAFSGSKFNSINAAKCISIGNCAFYDCAEAVTYNFPEVTSLYYFGIWAAQFHTNQKVTNIYMPKLQVLGASGNENVFTNIKTGCLITVNIAASTCNSGAPDGDLTYAINSRGATINYAQ
jgi:hypothetical protein